MAKCAVTGMECGSHGIKTVASSVHTYPLIRTPSYIGPNSLLVHGWNKLDLERVGSKDRWLSKLKTRLDIVPRKTKGIFFYQLNEFLSILFSLETENYVTGSLIWGKPG